MSLQQAIIMATEAVKMDVPTAPIPQMKRCLSYYIDACTELLKVIKAEPDPLRKSGLTRRMNTYMQRAELLKKRMRIMERRRDDAREAARRSKIYWADELLGGTLEDKGRAGAAAPAQPRPTRQVLEGKRLVALCFAAQWSGKSVEFVQTLRELYEPCARVSPNDLEIVFVSADPDDGQFRQFYSTHPWPCVPYVDRRRKGMLGVKFGVDAAHLPRLVVLDGANGRVICRDGVAALGHGLENAADPLRAWLAKATTPAGDAGSGPAGPAHGGAGGGGGGGGGGPTVPNAPAPVTPVPPAAPVFTPPVLPHVGGLESALGGGPLCDPAAGICAPPAAPAGAAPGTPVVAAAPTGAPGAQATWADAILPPTKALLRLKGGGGEKPAHQALAGRRVVGLYFSAHWCGPCRGFTPKLAQFYASGAAAAGLEIVFVSRDRDPGQFAEYWKEMPWPCLPFENREASQALLRRYPIQGIPSLVILDGATGAEITRDGRSDVESGAADPAAVVARWSASSR
jgi:nucleoredoxin